MTGDARRLSALEGDSVFPRPCQKRSIRADTLPIEAFAERNASRVQFGGRTVRRTAQQGGGGEQRSGTEAVIKHSQHFQSHFVVSVTEFDHAEARLGSYELTARRR